MYDLLWVDLVRAKDVDVVILPRLSLVLRPAVLGLIAREHGEGHRVVPESG